MKKLLLSAIFIGFYFPTQAQKKPPQTFNNDSTYTLTDSGKSIMTEVSRMMLDTFIRSAGIHSSIPDGLIGLFESRESSIEGQIEVGKDEKDATITIFTVTNQNIRRFLISWHFNSDSKNTNQISRIIGERNQCIKHLLKFKNEVLITQDYIYSLSH